jgi:hypothetical protein
VIDFDKSKFVKLSQGDPARVPAELVATLIPDERIVAAYFSGRDSLIVTDRRLVAVNVQGMTGKKVDYTSLPMSRIQAFSVETAGAMDRDAELEMWFSGLGKVKFEFSSGTDIRALAVLIGQYALR